MGNSKVCHLSCKVRKHFATVEGGSSILPTSLETAGESASVVVCPRFIYPTCQESRYAHRERIPRAIQANYANAATATDRRVDATIPECSPALSPPDVVDNSDPAVAVIGELPYVARGRRG